MAKVPSEKVSSRRELLGAGGAAALGLLLGGQALRAARAEVAPASSVKYGMVIDLERCMGCRACMMACKAENNTPTAVFWMYVFRFEEGHYPNVLVKYLPRPCMHCDNPPCVKVCPVAARYKRRDGLVATDFDRCIGCRYCEVACPYSVNYFNWKDPRKNQYLDWAASPELNQVTGGAIPPYRNPDLEGRYGLERRRIAGGGHLRGVIEKCTFCVHRIENGLLPACVANCPAGALHFGDLNDPDSVVSRLLTQKPSYRQAEEYGTEPRVYYLGTPPPGPSARALDAIVRRV